MKKTILLLLFQVIIQALSSQVVSKDTNNIRLWTITGGVHLFTKQKVKADYEPLAGLRIYSKPTYDFALEINRYFKLKRNWSCNVGLRIGSLPSNQGIDITENLTLDTATFDSYSRQSLPYLSIKGLIGKEIWKNQKFNLIQRFGTSLVLVPYGFVNYSISSINQVGIDIPYYYSKGSYNPQKSPFISVLSETSLIRTKNGEKKWFLSLSFEYAPKNVIASNYTFFSRIGNFTGSMTRRYEQMGIHFGVFWTFNKKRDNY